MPQPSWLTLPGLEGALLRSLQTTPSPSAGANPAPPLRPRPAPPRPRPPPSRHAPRRWRRRSRRRRRYGGREHGGAAVWLRAGRAHLPASQHRLRHGEPAGRAGGRAAVVPAVPARGSRWPCGGSRTGAPSPALIRALFIWSSLGGKESSRRPPAGHGEVRAASRSHSPVLCRGPAPVPAGSARARPPSGGPAPAG